MDFFVNDPISPFAIVGSKRVRASNNLYITIDSNGGGCKYTN